MKKLNIAVLFLCLFLTSCATYRFHFENSTKARGWTQQQSLAAFAYADRLYFLVLKEIEGIYKVNYARLDKREVREKLDKTLQDIDTLLSYKDEENTKYVETFGLRESLEREERVLKAIRDRVRAAELYDQFKQLIGEQPALVGDKEWENIYGYDIKQIFLSTDLAKTFEFSQDQIEEARQFGILKEIEHAQVSLFRKYDRKEMDPVNPDDPNSFIWRSKTVEVEVVNYKILGAEKPDSNKGNYLELFRLNNGKRESLPAFRLFFISDDSHGVYLIDTDREGEIGFGLPDDIDAIDENIGVVDILQDTNLINKLFMENKKQQRVLPKRKSVYVEIARVGEKTVDFWVDCPDPGGWKVIFKYKNQMENNYNVKLVFTAFDAASNPKNLKQIKYLKKEWTAGSRYRPSIGRVVEYYEMKPTYGKKNLLRASVMEKQDTKKVSFVFEDGSEDAGFILPNSGKYIEDSPVMIEYTEGQKRYRIKSEKNNAVYNKRKEVSTSSNNDTGLYKEVEVE